MKQLQTHFNGVHLQRGANGRTGRAALNDVRQQRQNGDEARQVRVQQSALRALALQQFLRLVQRVHHDRPADVLRGRLVDELVHGVRAGAGCTGDGCQQVDVGVEEIRLGAQAVADHGAEIGQNILLHGVSRERDLQSGKVEENELHEVDERFQPVGFVAGLLAGLLVQHELLGDDGVPMGGLHAQVLQRQLVQQEEEDPLVRLVVAVHHQQHCVAVQLREHPVFHALCITRSIRTHMAKQATAFS